VRAPRGTSGRLRLLAVLLVVVGAAVLLTQLVGGGGSGAVPASAVAGPSGTAPATSTATQPATSGSTAPSSAAATSGADSGADRPAGGAIVPTRLAIPAIGVDTTVESRGTVSYTNPFTGAKVSGYGVPTSMSVTSWWSDGPRPGSGQMAIVLGHSGHGVFDRLTDLHAGDAVTLRATDGTSLRLTVLGAPRTGLDKATSALSDALNAHPADAAVALVTCGGQFDESAHASEDNTVVFARLG
jgi:Sortase domain